MVKEVYSGSVNKMLPLIIGLACGANPSEISKLMSETTKRHQEAAEELRKKEEATKAQIEYEREKFESITDQLYEELEKIEYFVGSESMQERLIDSLDNVSYTLKIDRVLLFETMLEDIRNYRD